VGCYVGHTYVGVLASADDVTLLAPTPRAMRQRLKFCEEYSQKFRILFNAIKSACVLADRRCRRPTSDVIVQSSVR